MSYGVSSRKRRAPTPLLDEVMLESDLSPHSSPATTRVTSIPVTPIQHRVKRRRANLAAVLSSMSLGQRRPRAESPLPTYEESQETQDEVDEDDLFQVQRLPPSAQDDLQVEVLPESSSRRVDRQFAFSSQSESSDDESDGSSDAFKRPRQRYRRHAINTQQPDQVEQPATPWDKTDEAILNVEDVTSPVRHHKRRIETDAGRSRRRRRIGNDVDMDMDGDDDDTIGQIRSRKIPSSYEPQKDRELAAPNERITRRANDFARYHRNISV